MNYNQILAYIAAWIIDNQNKEITAAIMRDVLDKLVNFTDDRTGETDDLEQGNDLTGAVNILFGQVENISLDHPVNVHTGNDDPNIKPPANFSAPDFYIQDDDVVWLYNGTAWIKIVDSSAPQVLSLEQVLAVGNSANKRIIGGAFFNEKSDNDFAQIQDIKNSISENSIIAGQYIDDTHFKNDDGELLDAIDGYLYVQGNNWYYFNGTKLTPIFEGGITDLSAYLPTQEFAGAMFDNFRYYNPDKLVNFNFGSANSLVKPQDENDYYFIVKDGQADFEKSRIYIKKIRQHFDLDTVVYSQAGFTGWNLGDLSSYNFSTLITYRFDFWLKFAGTSPDLTEYLKYTAQSLTDPQQDQARENIGAVGNPTEGTIPETGTTHAIDLSNPLGVDNTNTLTTIESLTIAAGAVLGGNNIIKGRWADRPTITGATEQELMSEPIANFQASTTYTMVVWKEVGQVCWLMRKRS